MATFISPEEEQEKKDGTADAANASSALTTTTAAPSAGAGQSSQASQVAGAAGGAATGSVKPTSSGQFTDIGKYYDAGKENIAKAQSQVAQGLESKAAGAQQKLDQELGAYKQNLNQYKADAGTFQGQGAANVDQNKFGSIFQNVAPSNFTSAEGYGGLQQAGQNIRATQTGAGRAQALRNIADKGYSKGESRLDQALLNRAERGNSVLSGLRDKYSEGFADTKLDQAQTQAQQALTAVQAQRADTQNQAREWLKARAGTYNTEAQALQNQANERAQQEYKNMARQVYDDQMANYSAGEGSFVLNPGVADFETFYKQHQDPNLVGKADLGQLDARRAALQAMMGTAGVNEQLFAGQGPSDLGNKRMLLEQSLRGMLQKPNLKAIATPEVVKPKAPGPVTGKGSMFVEPTGGPKTGRGAYNSQTYTGPRSGR